jgi:hypothetical protein
MQTEILFSTLNNEAATLHVAKALGVHKLGKTFTQASEPECLSTTARLEAVVSLHSSLREQSSA